MLGPAGADPHGAIGFNTGSWRDAGRVAQAGGAAGPVGGGADDDTGWQRLGVSWPFGSGHCGTPMGGELPYQVLGQVRDLRWVRRRREHRQKGSVMVTSRQEPTKSRPIGAVYETGHRCGAVILRSVSRLWQGKSGWRI